MTDDRTRLEALHHEVKRLRRALETLPESQEGQRTTITERLAAATGEAKDLESKLARLEEEQQQGDATLTASERQYLASVVDKYEKIAGVYGDLTIEGQSQPRYERLTPAAMHFVELHHQVYESLTHSIDSVAQNSFRVDTFADLFHVVVVANPRIALIGDPGSGKSTTLGRLAYEYAKNALRAGEGVVPVFLDLASMASGESFASALDRARRDAIEDTPIAARPTVVLIDGLNETSHSTVEQIMAWLREYSAANVIVACRKIDYLDRTLPLRRIDILPLDVGQIHSFIGHFLKDAEDRDNLFWGLAGAEASSVWRWFGANNTHPTFENFWSGNVGQVYSYEVEKKRISELQTAVRRSGRLPGVLEVVRNPFLLYVAIVSYLTNDRLPDSRSELMRDFIRIMIERGGWSGSGVYDQRYVDGKAIDATQAELLLKQLAFEVTRAGFNTGVGSSWLAHFIRERLDDSSSYEQFVADVKRSGLLDWTQGSPTVVRFRHQLIQEYFASLRLGEVIAAGADAREFWPSDAWWETTPWDEVVLFLAGTSRDASALISWLAPVNPSLAYRCASAPGIQCASDVLMSLYRPGPNARACPIARAKWGRLMNEEGDPRPGVVLRQDGLPDIKWLRVPAAKYIVGGDTSLLDLGLHVPETEVEITHAFDIAMYPTTYGQFAAFVEHGYQLDQYWTDGGLEWRGHAKQPRLWDDPEYNFPNHPIVGVTWYEAVAFTRWLTEAMYGPVPHWWEVSLPTDAEWEVACRYPDGRRFAWGNVYMPGIANIDETFQGYSVGPYFLHQTTAVGLYERGRNALGAYDMCGNVWEWCLSKWDSPYQPADHISLNGTEHRVVRGDSWYNSVRFAPAAAHDCLDPDFGVNDTGFRVVRRKTALRAPMT
jgi:formylglycine-generating enzyme required for sulfatase activity